MKNKKGFFIIGVFVFCVLLLNFVSANMLVSDSGVKYDSRILEEFNALKMNETTNETFVKIIIDLNNPSQTDNLLSAFSNKELKDILVRSPSDGISAKISEEGFYKLLQDERVGKVYYNLPISALQQNKKILSLVIPISVFFILLSLILYLIIRKRKMKE